MKSEFFFEGVSKNELNKVLEKIMDRKQNGLPVPDLNIVNENGDKLGLWSMEEESSEFGLNFNNPSLESQELESKTNTKNKKIALQATQNDKQEVEDHENQAPKIAAPEIKPKKPKLKHFDDYYYVESSSSEESSKQYDDKKPVKSHAPVVAHKSAHNNNEAKNNEPQLEKEKKQESSFWNKFFGIFGKRETKM